MRFVCWETSHLHTWSDRMLFADLALARRLEDAWARLSVAGARAHADRWSQAGVAVEAIAGGQAVFLGAGSLVSQAQGLGLGGPMNESDLERLEAFYHGRGVPVQLEVCTLADVTLWPLLATRGYQPSEPSHMLVRPLEVGESWEDPQPPLRVEALGPGREELFVDTVMGSFFEGPEPAPDALRDSALTTALIPGTTCWLARYGDAPAGGAALFLTEGLALFAGDGVLPAHRGQGVHTALLRARLAHAGHAGADLAVTCTQPGSTSQRNAERLGFRVAYARFLFTRDRPDR
jgi:GNAT superfamily N-acetyltransferase